MNTVPIQLSKKSFVQMVPSMDKFKRWFYLQNDGSYKVVDLDPETHADLPQEDTITFSESVLLASDMSDDFELFMQRPEYVVGRADVIEREKNLPLIYDLIILGATLMRAREQGNSNPGALLDHIYKSLEWIHSTDFFEAPASTVYHESYPGGLLEHTLNVIKNTYSLLRIPKFSSVSLNSATLVAAMHDWCKIGNYEQYMKNVKNESGAWEQVVAYRRTGEPYPLGHGVLSMFYASRFVKLSVEESAAIRWHMGAWRVCKDELNDLQAANEKYPLVHLIQFADQLSITNY